MLLDYKMFDDGSFECFNFWISDQDGTYNVSHNDTLIQHIKELILKRMSQDERWLDTRKLELVYGGVQILEVRWS